MRSMVFGNPLATPTLKVGFVPLVDAAPLIAASEWGGYEREGLRVKISREIGWGTMRDKLRMGELDAVPLPVPMALATCPGAVVPYILSRQGNAITLSHGLRQAGATDGPSLARLVRSRMPLRLRLAVVARFSYHAILLDRWLKSTGLDPARQVRIVVIPPAQMVKNLADGLIDGFCAGEPWNTVARRECRAWSPATSAEILPDHPEKALVVSRDFAERRPDELAALVRALDAVSRRCESAEGRHELVPMLAQRQFLDIDESALASLTGLFEHGDDHPLAPGYLHRFHGGDCHRPTRSLAASAISAMADCGEILPAAATDSFREDLHDAAIASTATANQLI
jgi:ABC-type nitrate/sulfonate/bicarbonate transport system substrate-binding protein